MRTLHHLLLLCAVSIAVVGHAQPNTWTRVSDIGEADFSDSRLTRSSPVTFTLAGKAYMATGQVGTSALNDLWEYDPIANAWTQRASMPTVGRVDAVGFALNGKGYVATGITVGDVHMNDMWEYDPTGNSWTQRANVPGALRGEALAFVIGDTAYVGAGTNGTLLQNDFYAYDRINNVWLARANLPAGSGRQAPSGFAVGGKGYSVGGFGGTFSNGLNQFDPLLNMWTARAPLPAGGRMYGVAFSMGAFGYAGTGINSGGTSLNDFYQYDPVGDVWTPRTNVPGTGRRFAMGFALNGLGYIGLGNGATHMDDMHAFDPIANTWTARVGFGDKARSGAASFAVGGKGYVAGGFNDNALADMWAYDPVPNSWAQQADMPGGARFGHVMFAIGSKGYMGTGRVGASFMNDFWEYDPLANAWLARATVPSAFGAGRTEAAAFVIGTKGYICTGSDPTTQLTDLLEFDPVANTWANKASLPAFRRTEAAAFSIGTTGYLMGGFTSEFTGGSANLNQLWSYQQPTNTWVQLTALTGPRTGHVAFAIGSRGYVATGLQESTLLSSLHEYDPITGTWTTRATFPDVARSGASAFVIGERAYVGTGATATYVLPDVLKYEPLRDVTCQVTPFGGTICPGGTKTITWSPSGLFNAGNVFTAELSALGGSFALPTFLGSATTTAGGSMSVVIPTGLPAGAGYRIRMVASDPALNGTVSGPLNMQAVCTNNEPCEATVLTMNPNYTCTVTSPGVFVDFVTTLSTNITDNCSGYFNDVWFRFTATSTTHRIQLAGNTTGLQHSVFQGVCGALTQVAGSFCTTSSAANNPTGLIIGNTYWVRAGRIASGGYNSANGPFTICVSAPPVIDMRASALAAPATTGCYSSTQAVSITVLNAAFNPIDFSANPVTVTTNVTGTVTATLTATLTTGTLAPGATMNVPVTPVLNMSANGGYTFNASTSVAGDGNVANNAMTAVTINPWTSKALPVAQNFTGFVQGQVTGLAAPNDSWRTGTGLATPTIPNDGMFGGTAAQQAQLGSGPTGRLRFNNNQEGRWLLSPRFVPTASTQVGYRIAITEQELGTPEPAGMQPGESVIVHISTDCGLTYTPLFTHNSATTAGLSNTLVQQFVDLSAFAGQDVLIAFQGLKADVTANHPGYDLHLDDIAIQNYAPCAGVPVAGTASMNPAGPYCAPAAATLLLTGQATDVGITVKWYSSAVPGGPYTVIPGATGPAAPAAGLPIGTSFLVASVKCTVSGDSTLSNELSVVVNPTPTANASNNGPTCSGQNSQLTGVSDSGTSYNWSGPGGFASTSQNPLLSAVTTAQAGTYSFTATLAGCTSLPSATNLAVALSPQFTGVTGSPNPICINGTSQLNATVLNGIAELSFMAGTGALDPMVGATQALGSGNDDSPTASPINIGFPFAFNGVTHTQFSVSPDGWIRLGATTASVEFTNVTTSAANIPKIYPYWDDVATGTTGNVKYVVTGSAPDRILKVQWFVTIPRNLSGAANSTFQAWLYEGSGRFEFRYGAMGPGAMGASVGATATATLYQSVTIAGGTASTTVPNDVNSGQPASGTLYAFSVPTINYLWTPGTLLSANNIPNPVLGPAPAGTYPYSVVATDPATGCASTGNITITANPALSSGQANITPAAPTFCGPSGTTTLTANPTSGGAPYTYAWTRPNLAAAGTSQTQVADAAGTWSVLITDACGGSATATVVVVQVTIPSASASSTPGCLGQTLQLSGTSNIGTSFAWTGPNGFTSTQQNPAISPVVAGTAGTYSLISSANGCSSAPAPVVVSVNSPPTITSVTATPGTICPSGSSQLQATVSAGGAVPQYAFSSSIGTFVSVTGQPGTVVINTGSDENSFGPFALGFNFNYNGTTFSTAGVSANGIVAMGTTPAFTYTALSSGSNNVLVPFNSDLEGLSANGATMVYQSSGAPGSRVFTFEWKNWGFFNAGSANELSFQVKLFEGSNAVQFNYQNGTATGSGTVQVGLRGSSASAFLNRTTTTNWTATTAGGANTATCTVSAAVRPANGLTFTWTPPSANFAWAPATFLNNAAIANPLASAVTATTTYTVTATDAVTACATSSSVTVSLSTVDTDSDGIVDCIDNCPTVAGQIGSACDDGNAGTVNDVLIAGCVCQGTVGANVLVSARVILDGPYDSGTGLMGDGMRALGLVPTTEPYTGLGYSLVGGGSGITTAPVLAITGSNAVVDWVVLELRSSATPTTVLASRSALVQRDGDVVDVDGTSPVAFSIANGAYHVAVLHRNHLACMTAAAVALSPTATVVDFTLSATTMFGTAARKTSGGAIPVQVLWAGDATFNGQVKYTGSGNDRDPILTTVGSTTPNNTVTLYSTRDVNLNGQVKYTGSANDRDPILVNVGSTTPNNVRVQQLP